MKNHWIRRLVITSVIDCITSYCNKLDPFCFISGSTIRVTSNLFYSHKTRLNCSYQVSTSSSVVEEREVVYTSSQPQSSIQWDPLGGDTVEAEEEVTDHSSMSQKPVTVRFVLEESSGYMEPMLRILAVLHTVISFFCIIGYYCLKAGHSLLYTAQTSVNCSNL